LPVTLFVSPDAADRPGHAFLGWAALERLAAEGVAIGNHSLSHRHLTGLDDAALRHQVLDAQAILSDRLGAAPALFAYPYGEWSQPVRKLVGDAGFAAAFGQQSGVAWAGDDLLTLPRFPINERYGTPDRFALVTHALPLPLSDLEPSDPVVAAANPPRLRFTVAPGAGPLDGLACYASHIAAPIPLHRIGARRFEVALPGPLPPGRTRINCTLPAAGEGPRDLVGPDAVGEEGAEHGAGADAAEEIELLYAPVDQEGVERAEHAELVEEPLDAAAGEADGHLAGSALFEERVDAAVESLPARRREHPAHAELTEPMGGLRAADVGPDQGEHPMTL